MRVKFHPIHKPRPTSPLGTVVSEARDIVALEQVLAAHFCVIRKLAEADSEAAGGADEQRSQVVTITIIIIIFFFFIIIIIIICCCCCGGGRWSELIPHSTPMNQTRPPTDPTSRLAKAPQRWAGKIGINT